VSTKRMIGANDFIRAVFMRLRKLRKENPLLPSPKNRRWQFSNSWLKIASEVFFIDSLYHKFVYMGNDFVPRLRNPIKIMMGD